MITKMKSIGIEDVNNQRNFKMIEYINEGNERMKALRDLKSSERENKKLGNEEEKAEDEEEEEITLKE